jgi:hypothetical protein
VLYGLPRDLGQVKTRFLSWPLYGNKK